MCIISVFNERFLFTNSFPLHVVELNQSSLLMQVRDKMRLTVFALHDSTGGFFTSCKRMSFSTCLSGRVCRCAHTYNKSLSIHANQISIECCTYITCRFIIIIINIIERCAFCMFPCEAKYSIRSNKNVKCAVLIKSTDPHTFFSQSTRNYSSTLIKKNTILDTLKMWTIFNHGGSQLQA